MLGSLLLWAAVFGSLYAGFSSRALYVIPILGIVWSVGYVLFRPNSLLTIQRSAWAPIGLWLWNSALSGIVYGIGYLTGRAF